LGLYARNSDLRTEVDRLKGELASRDEELAKQKDELAHKDELFQQIKEDVIPQVACMHPEVDLSQTGLSKTIIDGKLMDVE